MTESCHVHTAALRYPMYQAVIRAAVRQAEMIRAMDRTAVRNIHMVSKAMDRTADRNMHMVSKAMGRPAGKATVRMISRGMVQEDISSMGINRQDTSSMGMAQWIILTRMKFAGTKLWGFCLTLESWY